MQNISKSLGLVLLVLSAAACGGSAAGTTTPGPARSTVRVVPSQEAEFLTEGSRTSAAIPAAPAEVWPILGAVFEQIGIPVTEVAPGALTLGNPGFEKRSLDGKRMSHYFDCGTSYSGSVANIYDVTITLSTSLTESPDGETIVTTTLDAWARPRMTSGNPVHCQSKQTLERRVEELVAEAVGSGR